VDSSNELHSLYGMLWIHPMNYTTCIVCCYRQWLVDINPIPCITSIITEFCESGKELINGTCTSCMRGYYKDNTEGDVSRFGVCIKCGDLDGKERTTDYIGSTSTDKCALCKCVWTGKAHLQTTTRTQILSLL